MNINEKLRCLAETRNMAAISERAGLSRSTVSSYVRRTKPCRPGCRAAFALAEALNVSLAWLLNDKADWPPVWENAEQMNPDQMVTNAA